MSFLPENYEAPKSGGSYMKLQDGENKIRILSKPILGYIDWKDNKPMRFRMDNKPLASVDPKKPVKHFWAFVIWNYATEQIEIMEVTQRGIQKSIETLSKDEEWKSPYFYDLKITRKGEGMDTEYFVNPSPHKYVGDYVVDQFAEKPCYLEALFDGADPFSKNWPTFTPGIFVNTEIDELENVKKEEKPIITEIQSEELSQTLQGCDPTYVDELKGSLKKLKIGSFKEIPSDLWDRIITAARKKSAEFKSNNEELPF